MFELSGGFGCFVRQTVAFVMLEMMHCSLARQDSCNIPLAFAGMCIYYFEYYFVCVLQAVIIMIAIIVIIIIIIVIVIIITIMRVIILCCYYH